MTFCVKVVPFDNVQAIFNLKEIWNLYYYYYYYYYYFGSLFQQSFWPDWWYSWHVVACREGWQFSICWSIPSNSGSCSGIRCLAACNRTLQRKILSTLITAKKNKERERETDVQLNSFTSQFVFLYQSYLETDIYRWKIGYFPVFP